MRIISGLYKGQSLVSFNADHIRPTTDRVKETLFNLLQLYLDESSIVADCFSGTGNLGIEALSRGAQHVSFIDNSTKSLQILKKNLHKIGVPSEHYRILSLDILSFFKKMIFLLFLFF
jgi:16S rRNA (guanine966-N2)-methyltransferase